MSSIHFFLWENIMKHDKDKPVSSYDFLRCIVYTLSLPLNPSYKWKHMYCEYVLYMYHTPPQHLHLNL